MRLMKTSQEEKAYVTELKRYFVEKIKKELPTVEFNGHSGDLERSTYTLTNVRLPFDTQKSLMLLFHLDLKGIACSKGSACQSGSAKGSHVLQEILPEEELKKTILAVFVFEIQYKRRTGLYHFGFKRICGELAFLFALLLFVVRKLSRSRLHHLVNEFIGVFPRLFSNDFFVFPQ